LYIIAINAILLDEKIFHFEVFFLGFNLHLTFNQISFHQLFFSQMVLSLGLVFILKQALAEALVRYIYLLPEGLYK
jgi:hypothetical protein